MDKFISELFCLRDCAHATHLATSSFAVHKTLNKFYDSLLDLTDSFAETWQGKYGRLNISNILAVQTKQPNELCNELWELANSIEKKLLKEDTDLLNILADMKGLSNRTKYLLTLK
jgi:hypothetical protein